MSEQTGEQKLSPMQWRATVARIIADQPELISATVEGLQAGVLAALERQRDRSYTLSLGLMEALNSRPGAARRNRQRIVEAIKVSQFYPTKWSEKILAREQPADEQ